MKSSRPRPTSSTGSHPRPGAGRRGSILRPINGEMLRKAAQAARSGIRRYPRQLLDSVRHARKTPSRVEPSCDIGHFGTHEAAAVWIGHATTLLRLPDKSGRPINILTDPVFSERIGMSIGLETPFQMTFGLSRLMPPALDIEHLPPIDLILISHAHFDHLDRPSLIRLARGPAAGATVITARSTRRLIPDGFNRVLELDWHREVRFRGLRIASLRPAHWGARAGLDLHRGYNSYVIRAGDRRILFAGDTAATDAFERVGRVDLSIFGIGAYESWDGAHANPEQVWRMFQGLGRGVLMPMHHSTFDMGEKHPGEPLERLLIAAIGHAERLVCKEPGSVWSPDRLIA